MRDSGSGPAGSGYESGRGSLPEEAFALALCAVEGLGPKALRRLLDDCTPAAAWASVVQGHHDDNGSKWRASAREIDVRRLWQRHLELGVEVSIRGDARYPEALCSDTESPAVLFSRGDLAVVGGSPRVAIIGTRSATRYGLSVAAQLGSELSGAGVSVVSGLAAGIDGAAHEGTCAASETAPDLGIAAAPPIAVVANGLDSAYPASHGGLFNRIIGCGVVLSESPIGIPPARWRFPRRNRILAALADVVVVVECHLRGGSLITVHEAANRGVVVGAVPGSVRSPSSAGTNDLLADGCLVVHDATDVLVAIDLVRAGDVPVRPTALRAGRPGSEGAQGKSDAGTRSGNPPRIDDPIERAVFEMLDPYSASVEQISVSTGLSLAEVTLALEHLSASGLVTGEAGWWQRE